MTLQDRIGAHSTSKRKGCSSSERQTVGMFGGALRRELDRSGNIEGPG